jgi:cytochrome c-type biogenesis protein CcmH/NrfF
VALLGAGVVFLVALLRRGRGETATLDAAERARLAALLGDAPPGADDSGAEDRSR